MTQPGADQPHPTLLPTPLTNDPPNVRHVQIFPSSTHPNNRSCGQNPELNICGQQLELHQSAPSIHHYYSSDHLAHTNHSLDFAQGLRQVQQGAPTDNLRTDSTLFAYSGADSLAIFTNNSLDIYDINPRPDHNPPGT